MASPSPSPSKLTSPAKTPNPAKKRRVDNLTDIIKSTGDDFDTQITSCLYHMGKKGHNTSHKNTRESEEINEGNQCTIYTEIK